MTPNPGPPVSGPDTGFALLGERVVHEGYALDVTVGEFSAPDGSTFTRDIVRHRGAVAVLPLHDDGTVTIVRQYRPALEAELLEIPAGIRDVEGEDPAATAARELAEEAGLSAERMDHLISFHNAPGYADEVIHIYLATGLHEVPIDSQGPEEEAMTVERHHLEVLVDMIRSGTVTDAKTVIALLLVAGRGGR